MRRFHNVCFIYPHPVCVPPAVAMHNFSLWHPTSCVIFLAPTRPLAGPTTNTSPSPFPSLTPVAAQQMDACARVVPLPSAPLTRLLTGASCHKSQRSKVTLAAPCVTCDMPITPTALPPLQAWLQARFIFATPQVLANDLRDAWCVCMCMCVCPCLSVQFVHAVTFFMHGDLLIE